MAKLEDGQRALKECAMYLGGSYAEVSSEDITFDCDLGGKSNVKFRLTLPDGHIDRFRDVLVRFYGSTLTEDGKEYKVVTEAQEAVVFQILSSKFNGPKLLGIFPGGRIEEYVNVSGISPEEYESSKVAGYIAGQLAVIHSLDMPISKVAPSLVDMAKTQYVKYTKNEAAITSNNPFYKEYLSKINFRSEVKWLQAVTQKIPSRTVFVHNDLNIGNIVRRNEWEDPENRYLILDYEYCCYSYRWADLSCYFCEVAFSNFKPGEELAFEKYPEEKERREFIRAYLEKWRAIYADYDNDLDSEDAVVLETDFGCLWIHLIRIIWILAQKHVDNEAFHLWDYAMNRFRFYRYQKKMFLQKYTEFGINDSD